MASQKKNTHPPRLRRAYFDCRYGQLHVHNAIPAGGGFDELTPVICVPAVGVSARMYQPLLHALGFQRSVYALDLPGAGESDPAPGVAATAAGAHAVLDFVQSMRIRSFDLIATDTGVDVAAAVLELAAASVRRAVLVGGRSPPQRSGDKISVWPATDLSTELAAAKLVAALGAAV